MYILLSENISLFPFISWFVLYLILQAFTNQNATITKFTDWQVLFFSLLKTRSGLLAGIRWSVYILKSQRILNVLFSRMYSGLSIYPMSVEKNPYLLHVSQWIIFPIQSFLVLYFFYASYLHSVIMGLTILSLSPHNLHNFAVYHQFFTLLGPNAIILYWG